MNISAPWIRRPVATALIAIGILLIGTVAYVRLPIAALPSVDRPTIGVWGVCLAPAPTQLHPPWRSRWNGRSVLFQALWKCARSVPPGGPN